LILFLTSISEGSLASCDLRKAQLLLADKAYEGVIQSVEALVPPGPWAYYKFQVKTDDGTLSLYSDEKNFGNFFHVDGEKKLFLVSQHATPQGVMPILLRFPVLGVLRPSDISNIDEEIEDARVEAFVFLKNATKCSARYISTLGMLSGVHQQRAVDELYAKRPLASEELACLIDAISSKKRIVRSSFEPPYVSKERIFHHGLPTLGDLVAELLPHLANVEIHPTHSPMRDEDRKKLSEAWACWGNYRFGERPQR